MRSLPRIMWQSASTQYWTNAMIFFARLVCRVRRIIHTLQHCKMQLNHYYLCFQLMEMSERRVRGPYLARLELHKRMQVKDLNAIELLGDFESLIIEYFHLFGDKPCCIQDISIYLPQINTEQRKQLATKLLAETGITATELPQTVSAEGYHIFSCCNHHRYNCVHVF